MERNGTLEYVFNKVAYLPASSLNPPVDTFQGSLLIKTCKNSEEYFLIIL
jgi:hypothetical protein